MILIFGGAYQGKLDYALKTFDKTEDDVFCCAPVSRSEDPADGSGQDGAGGVNGADGVNGAGGAYDLKGAYEVDCDGRIDCQVEIDWSKPVIYGLENWVYLCTLAGVEARDILAERRCDLSDKILIGCDVSQGLVPMDAAERAFREMMGRTLLYLAAEADRVDRVFCGLGQQLK